LKQGYFVPGEEEVGEGAEMSSKEWEGFQGCNGTKGRGVRGGYLRYGL